ncbi:LysR family transcriptional regulator [Marinimicrobium alkaliphilum]|uniref:LysR family transcriptional regulator n=1 Tax=Marinimicrobium alkaliphilum TaxID=2202654 RepID=UPI000DB98952|nr:LysR family transcriptional regulator [Marinimicrobium alkaliphilum]
MDRFTAMRAFVTVVAEGSFTRASERLGISTQLVSKYVGQLEGHLGVRLLNRTTRQLHLTEAGTAYHLRARQLLEELEAVEGQLSNWQHQARGRLRISAPVSFAALHLGPLLADFQQTYPGIEIDLQLNDRKVDIVDEGFDIALRIGRLQSSSLVAKRIAPVRMVLCASPAYLAARGTPDSLAALKAHRFLRYSYMDESEPLLKWLASETDEQAGLVTNNGDVLTRLAEADAGLVLQPTFIVGPAIEAGRLRVLLPEHEPEPLALYAVYAHRRMLATKVRAFVDFIAGYFGDPPYWDAFRG